MSPQGGISSSFQMRDKYGRGGKRHSSVGGWAERGGEPAGKEGGGEGGEMGAT